MSSPEQIQQSPNMAIEKTTSQNEDFDYTFSRRELGKKILQTTQKIFSQVSGNELLVAGGEIIVGSAFFLGLSERTKSEKDKRLLQKAGTFGVATGFTVFETGMAVRSLKKRIAHTHDSQQIQTVFQMKTPRLPRRKHSH